MTQRLATLLLTVLVLGTVGPALFAGPAAAADVTLTVVVEDSNGETVEDVNVTVSWADETRASETFAIGKAFFDVPEGNEVTIDVDDDVYIRNEPVVVSDVEEQTVTLDVSRQGTATVTAEDPNGPVEDARVRLSQGGQTVVSARTASDGTVTTAPVEQGDYTLSVVKPGYASNLTSLTIDGDVTKTMRIEESSVLVTLTVIDDHFDEPKAIENARISVEEPDSTVTTTGSGEQTLRLPVNRQYDVSVTKDGYDTTTLDISVGESALEETVTINRSPNLTVTPANSRIVVGETVEVTVTDEYGEPVADATVDLDGQEVGTTNEDGVISVPIEASGEHTIEAAAEGLSAEATVEGVSGADATPTDTQTTATETTTTTGGVPGGAGPGFGPVVAVLAVVGAGLLARRRAG
jgi:PGF-CTERM protein